MRNVLLALTLIAFTQFLHAAPPAKPALADPPPSDWRTRVEQSLPLLGHRNWILIVDSAYPLQSAPAIETVETDASQLEAVRFVLAAIDRSIHVRPVISMDAELPYIPEDDAPGVSTYRTEIKDLLSAYSIESVPHDKVIAGVEEASRHFNILVLKTTMTVPYTSVFIRLDCKYWSADAEKRLRAKMATAPRAAH